MSISFLSGATLLWFLLEGCYKEQPKTVHITIDEKLQIRGHLYFKKGIVTKKKVLEKSENVLKVKAICNFATLA